MIARAFLIEQAELIKKHRELALKKVQGLNFSEKDACELALTRWRLDQIRKSSINENKSHIKMIQDQQTELSQMVSEFRNEVEACRLTKKRGSPTPKKQKNPRSPR